MTPKRVVADLNIVVSGLLWGGPPMQALKLTDLGFIELYGSPELLDHLAKVLKRRKFSARIAQIRSSPTLLIQEYRRIVTSIEPAAIDPVVRDDPDDDKVLACAIAANAEAIVSGDQHLLVLREFHGIPILTARQLLERLGLA